MKNAASTSFSSQVIVVGLALFAMFFGAGNLIFPPWLGMQAGKEWPIALLGFLMTGIGIPLMGTIAITRVDGNLAGLADKVSPIFSKVLGAVVILSIGPMLAMPRTGAVAFELGIQPVFPGFDRLLFSVIYFGITFLFVAHPTSVVDKIGKLLTPFLLLMLAILIVKGIIWPIGQPGESLLVNPFAAGFTEGYQTMDGLGSIAFGGMVMTTLAVVTGIAGDRAFRVAITVRGAIAAVIGLGLVYGGFLYLGAGVNGSTELMASIGRDRASLTSGIANTVLGNAAKVIFGLVVASACLTTAIGLAATSGDYFYRLSGGRISYRVVVVITLLFSTIVSNVGLEMIVKLAVPLLVAIYPVVMVLIVLNLLDHTALGDARIVRGAVLGAMVVSLPQGIVESGLGEELIGSIIGVLPLAHWGFAWIMPSMLAAILFRCLCPSPVGSHQTPVAPD